MAGIVALYAYDATVLLYADELVAWPRRRGWSAHAGGELQWRGGFLFVPALYWPSAPLLRLRWLQATRPPAAPRAEARVAILQQALRPLQWAVWLMAALLFLVLPLVLLAWRRDDLLLVLLAAIYLLAGAMVTYLVRARQRLGLPPRAVAALAIDTLACPPFALNLVRKIGLRQALDLDALAFTSRMLPSPGFQRLRPRLLVRLDALLLAEPEDNERSAQLKAARARLLEEEPHGNA